MSSFQFNKISIPNCSKSEYTQIHIIIFPPAFRVPFLFGKIFFSNTPINSDCPNNLCLLLLMSTGLYPLTLIFDNYKQKLLPESLSAPYRPPPLINTPHTRTHTYTLIHRHTNKCLMAVLKFLLSILKHFQ